MSYQSEKILYGLQELVFKKYGKGIDSISQIKADASERKIYRINSGSQSLIGVYNENTNENTAFIKFSETFLNLGLRVPQIYTVSDDKMLYLEEDLGDMTLHKLSLTTGKERILEYYKKALTDLTDFQISTEGKIDYKYCYQTEVFDKTVLLYDIKKFSDYFLSNFTSGNISKGEIESVSEAVAGMISKSSSDYFLYRDFQPRNIMIKDNELYYIDYQSGRRGPLQYDAASFLYSGSININEDERIILLEHYEKKLSDKINLNLKEFRLYFYYFAIARLLQVLGSYAFIFEKRKDATMKVKISNAVNKLGGLIEFIDNDELKSFIKNLKAGYTGVIHT